MNSKDFLEDQIFFDGNMFTLNIGTEKLVDNLDKGVSTFIRLPRQNKQSITSLLYGLYMLNSTDKSIVIISKRLEDARMSKQKIIDVFDMNTIYLNIPREELNERIHLNITPSCIKELAENNAIGMIIYDDATLEQLKQIKHYNGVLITISSIYYNTDSIKDILDKAYISYIEYSYQELGLTEEWFNEMCKLLSNKWDVINREILLKFD